MINAEPPPPWFEGSVPFSRREEIRIYIGRLKKLIKEIVATYPPLPLNPGVEVRVPVYIKDERDHASLTGDCREVDISATTMYVHRIRITPKLLEWAKL